jgi:hypothetical protein
MSYVFFIAGLGAKRYLRSTRIEARFTIKSFPKIHIALITVIVFSSSDIWSVVSAYSIYQET